MIKIRQNQFGNQSGNCLAACIASLLEVPLNAVPQPEAGDLDCGPRWLAYIERLHRDFLLPKGYHLHYCAACFDGDEDKPYIPPGYSIASYKVHPDSDILHSVVVYDGKNVWDPADGAHSHLLTDRRGYNLLVPHDPIRLPRQRKQKKQSRKMRKRG